MPTGEKEKAMNNTQLANFIFTHATAEIQKQTKHYPFANPREGVASNWIMILDFGGGQQITVNDESRTIWQRENK